MSRFGAFQFYGNGRGGAFGGAAVRMAERAGQTPSLEIFANNRDIHLPVSLRRQDRRPRLFPEDHVGRFEPGPAWRSPCATVQCQQGWNLMGADERGCSGTCEGEPQVCCEAVMTAPCLPCAADQVLPVLQRHEHQRLHGHLGRRQQGRCATCKGEFGAPASKRRAPATRRSGKGTDGAADDWHCRRRNKSGGAPTLFDCRPMAPATRAEARAPPRPSPPTDPHQGQ